LKVHLSYMYMYSLESSPSFVHASEDRRVFLEGRHAHRTVLYVLPFAMTSSTRTTLSTI